MPERLPALTSQDLAGLVGKTYPEIAWFVLRRFTSGIIDDAKLRALCETPTTMRFRSNGSRGGAS